MKRVTTILGHFIMVFAIIGFSVSFADPPQIKPLKPKIPPKPIPPPALAAISNARIIECSGGTVGPARLVIVWTYSSGLRPEKLTIDVQREREGSVLAPRGIVIEVSGKETRKEVTIWRLYDVPYTLIFTAYYGPWGKRIYTFVKRCGE